MSEIDVVGFNPSDFKYRKRVERYRIESKTDSRRNVSTPIDNNISQPEPVVNSDYMQNSEKSSNNKKAKKKMLISSSNCLSA